MADPMDIYCDQFQITAGPFGCAVTLSISPGIGISAGSVLQPERAATVRMSLESLKALAFLLHSQVVQYEDATGVQIPVPTDALRQMKVDPTEWKRFWRRPGSGDASRTSLTQEEDPVLGALWNNDDDAVYDNL